MNNNNWAHQGDIIFKPVSEFKGPKEDHKGSFIVGFGEATGHHHTVSVDNLDDMEVVKIEGGFILRLKSEGTVTHQEHKPIKLAPGVYEVRHEREMDWFSLSTRRVVD